MKQLSIFDQIAARICALRPGHPVRVGIDGISAAGKSTVANQLVTRIEERGRPVIRASIDGFHNSVNVRTCRGEFDLEGYYWDSFNIDAIIENLLRPLGADGDLRYRAKIYDLRNEKPVDSEFQISDPDTVLLFDGVMLFRPELLNYWDFRIFIVVDFKVAYERALHRDKPRFGDLKLLEMKYKKRYLPAQMEYLKRCTPMEKADLVIDNNDPSNPVVR